jgi:hypothetical protein
MHVMCAAPARSTWQWQKRALTGPPESGVSATLAGTPALPSPRRARARARPWRLESTNTATQRSRAECTKVTLVSSCVSVSNQPRCEPWGVNGGARRQHANAYAVRAAATASRSGTAAPTVWLVSSQRAIGTAWRVVVWTPVRVRGRASLYVAWWGPRPTWQTAVG